ncbi:MAG TPA: hypothetical protein VJJ22_01190 [Candidatus Paceibacterota bacterium]
MPRDKTLITSLLLLASLIIILVTLTKVTVIEQTEKVPVSDYAKVSLTDQSNTSDPNTEYLTINIAPPGNSPTVVTGWKIVGGKYNINVGKASTLPKQGKINEEVPIVITKPSVLIISTGHSPIGVSFRENKCTGILGYYQIYTPPLTPSCENCLNKTDYPDYNKCVEEHRNESDFFINAWRVYVGTDIELWAESFEVIRLYNQEGALLDSLRH